MSIQLSEIKKKKTKVESGQSDWIKQVLTYDISLSGKGFSAKKKEAFFNEFYILLSSGLDFRSALEIIVTEQTNQKDKKIFTDLYDKVVHGSSLSEVMQESGKFTEHDYYSMQIGEETGRIDEVLFDLRTYYNRNIKQRRQLVSVFSYPILVLITAFAAVFFMLNVMVPKFQEIFNRSNTELPTLTKTIVRLSRFSSDNAGIFLLIIIAIVIFLYAIRKKEIYKRISSKLLLHLPFFGKIIRMSVQQKLFQMLALLIGSKLTLSHAVQLVQKMTTFYPMQIALDKIEQGILRGKSLHESMSECPVFDKRAISLVKVAEEVNKLEDIFQTLSDQYSEQTEHTLGILGTLLEPVLIIFIGALVGVILIAMYLPMFQMGSAIQ